MKFELPNEMKDIPLDDLLKQVREGKQWCKDATKKLITGGYSQNPMQLPADFIGMNMVVNTMFAILEPILEAVVAEKK